MNLPAVRHLVSKKEPLIYTYGIAFCRIVNPDAACPLSTEP